MVLARFIFSIIISGWAQLGYVILAAVAAGSWGYCHERFEETDQSLVDEKFYTSTSFLS